VSPMVDLSYFFNPPQGLTLSVILLISFILGLFHGATPDEHTWPIPFSYASGSYSTRRGMKAGFMFSSGFAAQRALLPTLEFLGLAAVYRAYDLNGPIYLVVGAVMAIAGSYVLRGRYLHLPFDRWLHGGEHHTGSAKRLPETEHMNAVSLPMAAVHGLVAGFGFGAYATIITFVLAPQVPGLMFAPLPGLAFGLGTMVMQVALGAVFASFARARKLSEDDVCYLGRYTGGRTLYYGGYLFALVGIFVTFFPSVDAWALGTGTPIPNLDTIGLGTVLVLAVVGGIGLWSLVQGFWQVRRIDSGVYCHPRAESSPEPLAGR
jgi:hypothetical protein